MSLSADPARRSDRALAAAQVSLSAGAFDVVQSLLTVAEAGPTNERQRARVELLCAQLAFVSGHGSDAPPLLLEAAKRLEPLDVELARETYLNALSALVLAGRAISRDDGVVEVSRAARAAPPAQHPPRGADLLLDGLGALYVEGRGAAVTDPDAGPPLVGPGCAGGAGAPLVFLGLLHGCAAVGRRDVAWAMRAVRRTWPPDRCAERDSARAHRSLSYVRLFCGELDAAASLIGEIERVDGSHWQLHRT